MTTTSTTTIQFPDGTLVRAFAIIAISKIKVTYKVGDQIGEHYFSPPLGKAALDKLAMLLATAEQGSYLEVGAKQS